MEETLRALQGAKLLELLYSHLPKRDRKALIRIVHHLIDRIPAFELDYLEHLAAHASNLIGDIAMSPGDENKKTVRLTRVLRLLDSGLQHAYSDEDYL